ncbi:MAG TPA: Asp-tRNA(Asn)/Glu-tRNA(Gln) amidotransferase GatCAB subunit B, partial [Chitinophagaceae bacterium]|nr:Asp-tRNA(Asn)/Glu-tRNA(Gln) amidotransferase GatCAB subunit B [Chitinophagaceae bacterium]
ITEEKAFADYFEQVILHTKNYKAAANWMLGPVKSWLNEQKKDIDALPILPEKLASVIQLIDEGKVNFSIASTAIFPQLLQNPSLSAAEIAQKQDLLQDSDMSSIEPVIDEILNTFADKVSAYQKGKKGLLAFFVGQVMKKTNGKADPQLTNTILLEKLNHYTKK